MPATNPADTLNLLEDLAKTAKAKGATAYAFNHYDGDALSVSVRNGQIQEIPGDTIPNIGFQIHMGKKIGTASSTSSHPSALKMALENAIHNARFASQDSTKALAHPDQISTAPQSDLQLNDPYEPTLEELIEQARQSEAAALSVHGITNSDETSAHWGRSISTFLFSNGFHGQNVTSSNSLYTCVIAGTDNDMETNYGYTNTRWRSDMATPEFVGKQAAERTLAMLNARSLKTMDVPVIFENRLSSSLVSAFLSAIGGNSLYYKTTFLRREDMGKQLFRPDVQIIEDPFILRGQGSDHTDDVGMARHKMALVADGKLQTWLVGLQSGRKLKMAPTGHTGGTSNVYMAPGTQTLAEMMQEMGTGLLVTGSMGRGPNIMTGDYSAPVSGFWVENGVIAYPVSGITLAGKLQKMMATAKPANDLDIMRSNVTAPSIRIDGLKLGGQGKPGLF